MAGRPKWPKQPEGLLDKCPQLKEASEGVFARSDGQSGMHLDQIVIIEDDLEDMMSEKDMKDEKDRKDEKGEK
ncbi:hypothetical protein HIM_07758 [Hirsutella minnesotensis 3608]|uniref:Uncharacterized protein n=1 Tax=Hirsutella minnesotensis 3608 TaxID=1043627 RepID=A0A0F8A420_9HYPO|nr:hypothetical protein HIM_07758 [Hirsutella minnesotensis 3608]